MINLHRPALRATAILATATGLIAAVGVSSASANVSGSFTIRNKATGLCLDSDYTGHAYTLACNGGTYQAWAISSNSDNSHAELADIETGRSLKFENNLSTVDTDIPTLPVSLNYLFYAIHNGNGTWTFSNMKSGMVLDTTGNLQTYEHTPIQNDAYQQWILTPTNCGGAC